MRQEGYDMKWRLTWGIVLVLVLVISWTPIISCGDDDDDDDDSGGWSCSEACSIIYDECNYAMFIDGVQISKAECVDGCGEYGGMNNCTANCLDIFEQDEDCVALEECAVNCEY